MGLREIIGKAAIIAFGAAGDLKITVTYTSKGAPSYNAATGIPSSSDINYTIEAVRQRYAANEIDGDVVAAGDVKLMILASSLAATPKPNDTVTIGAEIYSVVSILSDVSNSLHLLQLRLV